MRVPDPAAGRFDLDDLRAHCGKIAGRRRTGDHPAEIENPDTSERQVARLAWKGCRFPAQ